MKTSKTPGPTARPSRLWRFVANGVAVLMATYGVAYAVGVRRAPVMQAAAEAARAAVADARAADAMTWAPDRLLTAEAALRDALAAQRIETDAKVTFHFTLDQKGLVACRRPKEPDLTISASAYDFLMLALRKEDPDTLFFSRRLCMEGDTELGLLVKNTLTPWSCHPSISGYSHPRKF